LKLAREGYPFVTAGVLLAVLGWVGVAVGIGGAWLMAISGVSSLLALFTLWFFRDPAPTLPADARSVVAPGQGKVISISEVDEPTFLGDRARRITIFLSVFDVHVQRAPVSGIVEHRVYTPGKYLVAWKEKASAGNEQSSLGISTRHGPVLVRQIAGLIARRIITDPSEGDAVVRGNRLGIIRFGSRVDLFLPLDWEVISSVGDRVRVGSSVLARQPTSLLETDT
jgi:phosphatidylserine decarboxylase